MKHTSLILLCLLTSIAVWAGPSANLLECPKSKVDKGLWIHHTGFTINYNRSWRIPNWVAYTLYPSDTQGKVPRASDFEPDPATGTDCATNDDYRGSGWDRGHMAPAGDMKWNADAMRQSFYFSNICPQNRNLNGGDWRLLEERLRIWAQQGDTLYIVCGPLPMQHPRTIGPNKVAVPEAFFKVVLRHNRQGWSAIGFIMPNTDGKHPLSYYACSIDEVEKKTHNDFFYQLPDKLENQLEASYQINDWKWK